MDDEKIQQIKKEEREKRLKVAAVALLTTLSFSLGYLFASQTSVAPIIIEKCSE